jgi:hypothetical protein
VTGADTGSVSLKGDADATLTLTVNHNHDSNYLKLTGGVLTGWTYMGTQIPQYVSNNTVAPVSLPAFSQLRRAPIEALWAISGQLDHLYMAHRNGYTITSNIAGVNTDSLFTYNLADDCYVPTGSLPWILTITKNSGAIEITDVLQLIIVPHRATNDSFFFKDWKVEVQSNTDSTWMTVLQRTGVNDHSILGIPTYYKTDANTYMAIKAIRITVNQSDPCAWMTAPPQFGIGRLMLVNSRTIGSAAQGVGALDIAGGTMLGNVNWAYGVPQVNGAAVWHPGNDGPDSGLDADLLDGHHASDFALASGAGYLELTGGDMTGSINMTNSASIDMGNAKITSLGDPLNPQEAATKHYVDAVASGITWLSPVISKTVTAEPATPTAGDRYIIPEDKTGTNWSAIAVNRIVEWDGDSWTVTTPALGNQLFCQSDSFSYNYNGSAWIQTSGQISHQNLTNIMGTLPGEPYHISAAEYTALRGGSSDASSLHNHASLYLGKTAKADDSDKLDGMQPATASTVSTIAQRDSNGYLTAKQLISDITDGTAPLQVTSSTVVTNLNANLLQGHPASDFALASGAGYLPLSGGDLVGIVTTTSQIQSTVQTGTAPFTIQSTTKVDNLNAGLLEGHPAGDFALASGAGYLPLSGGDMTGAINMGGYNVTGINNLQIADTGYGEGLEWVGGNAWMICESPDDKSDASGDLQVFQNGTRRMTLRTTGALEVPGGVTANVTGNLTTSGQITSTYNSGAPFSITSSTKVTNLNSDLLDGYHAATTATVDTVALRDSSGNLTANVLNSDVLTGAPLTVKSTTAVTNFNADMLDGKHLSDLDSRYSGLSKVSATLPATIGWYRIAVSATDIGRNGGLFDIDWSVSGYHGRATLLASVHYGQTPNISMLGYSAFGGSGGLTKARIVYHSTYSGNYAYLEVYLANAVAPSVSVQLLDGKGWTLQTPSTAGGIPSQYLTSEIAFDEGFVANGSIVAQPYTNSEAIIVQQPNLYNDKSWFT